VSTGVATPLVTAMAIAAEVQANLAPAVERIEVAGSIRRQVAEVHDIELVAVPRLEERTDGLFGLATVNLLTERVDLLIDRGVLSDHPEDRKRGARYSKLVHFLSGMQVDLFSTTTDQFGITLLIRTGPAAYSQAFVTGLRRRGFHAAGGELHRGGLGCGAYACEKVPCPDEREMHDTVGMRWVPPYRRIDS
jgi:DNA polymerase/3'-5' exonuclease PolX